MSAESGHSNQVLIPKCGSVLHSHMCSRIWKISCLGGLVLECPFYSGQDLQDVPSRCPRRSTQVAKTCNPGVQDGQSRFLRWQVEESFVVIQEVEISK